jgi:hypothetical protein
MIPSTKSLEKRPPTIPPMAPLESPLPVRGRAVVGFDITVGMSLFVLVTVVIVRDGGNEERLYSLVRTTGSLTDASDTVACLGITTLQSVQDREVQLRETHTPAIDNVGIPRVCTGHRSSLTVSYPRQQVYKREGLEVA